MNLVSSYIVFCLGWWECCCSAQFVWQLCEEVTAALKLGKNMRTVQYCTINILLDLDLYIRVCYLRCPRRDISTFGVTFVQTHHGECRRWRYMVANMHPPSPIKMSCPPRLVLKLRWLHSLHVNLPAMQGLFVPAIPCTLECCQQGLWLYYGLAVCGFLRNAWE